MFLNTQFSSERFKAMHKILDENLEKKEGALWLGNLSAALDKKAIDDNNIKTVITAAASLYMSYTPDIVHIVYPMQDVITYNISRFFELAIN
jgi:hypothetical protein